MDSKKDTKKDDNEIEFSDAPKKRGGAKQKPKKDDTTMKDVHPTTTATTHQTHEDHHHVVIDMAKTDDELHPLKKMKTGEENKPTTTTTSNHVLSTENTFTTTDDSIKNNGHHVVDDNKESRTTHIATYNGISDSEDPFSALDKYGGGEKPLTSSSFDINVDEDDFEPTLIKNKGRSSREKILGFDIANVAYGEADYEKNRSDKSHRSNELKTFVCYGFGGDPHGRGATVRAYTLQQAINVVDRELRAKRLKTFADKNYVIQELKEVGCYFH